MINPHGFGQQPRAPEIDVTTVIQGDSGELLYRRICDNVDRVHLDERAASAEE